MLRPATLQDVPALLDIYRPYILETAFTFEYEVPSLQEFTERFEAITDRHPWLVWEEDGVIAGYAYGHPAFTRAAYQWMGDLAIYLRPEYFGKGIGRKLYTAVEEIMAKQGFCSLYGVVTSANEGSCRFHEAMGYREAARFERCGFKFGQWYGTVWYEKRLREDIPTLPPVSWHTLDLKGVL